MPTIWFLFWGTENDKEEELPEQARALTGSYQPICCLTVPLHLQSVSHLSRTWFPTQESSSQGFLSFLFIQGCVGWRASVPASAIHQNMTIKIPTSLLFCLGLWQMNLLESCVFSSASLYTWKYCLFSVSCLFFNPSWWTSWLHNYAEWSQKGCAAFGLCLRAPALASGLAVLLPEEYKTQCEFLCIIKLTSINHWPMVAVYYIFHLLLWCIVVVTLRWVMMTQLTTVVMHLKLGNLSLMAFQHRCYKTEMKF